MTERSTIAIGSGDGAASRRGASSWSTILTAVLARLYKAGSMIGMTTAKIAVTIPEQVLRQARGAVRRGQARSLSAYVSAALAQKTMLDDLDTLLTEMLAQTGGPLTKAEERAADLALDGPRPRRPVRR